jgi:microcystin-dependent protein
LTETGVDATAFETFVRGDLFRAILRTQHADLFAGTTVGSGTVPTGAIAPYAGTLAPESWLLCSGQAVLRSQYEDLYAVISNRFGAVTDDTTFRLPDLRGRVPVGAGTGSGLTARSLSQTTGAETHQLTIAEMPSHSHSPNGQADFLTWDGGSLGVASGGGLAQATGSPSTTGSTGNDGFHNNMQPSIVLNYIIRT